jgi:transcriptional regulator with XRE-family HTH domain
MKFYSSNLKEIRKQKKCSSQELADKLGLHRTTISGWERDKIIPNEYKIRQIAKALNISVD